MNWEVTVKIADRESTYVVSADKYYSAKVGGLTRFLEQYNLPGAPYEYMTGKKHAEISVKSIEDRRKKSPSTAGQEFFAEQCDKMRRWVRQSELNDKTKVKATKLLVQLKGVLSGT